MATKRDPDRADEAPAEPAPLTSAQRIKGAQFLGGVWVAPDGTPLTDAEAQKAHRAIDAAAMRARLKVQEG